MDNPNLDPSVIGGNFLVRYYTVLNKNPELLHNFYSERSVLTLGHEEQPEGKTVKGLENINKQITSYGYEDCKVSLSVVDCQPSINGGVFISVIGFLSNKGEEPRKFTQSFLLERVIVGQEASYYVLNDVFRFLLPAYEEEEYDEGDQEELQDELEEEEEYSEEPSSPDVTQAVEPPQQKPMEVAAKSEPITAQAAIQPAQPSHQVSQTQPPVVEPKPVVEKKEAAPVAPRVEPVAVHEPSVPKSWVSIVTRAPTHTQGSPEIREVERPAPGQAQAQPQAQPQAQQQQQQQQTQQQSQQLPQTQAQAQAQPQREQQYPPPKAARAPPLSPILQEGCSIYASNLPFEATHDQLVALFGRYGKVRNVVLKAAKGFAFVEYENPEAVQQALKAIQLNPPHIDGRALLIEERKSRARTEAPPSRGRGRGGMQRRAGGGFNPSAGMVFGDKQGHPSHTPQFPHHIRRGGGRGGMGGDRRGSAGSGGSFGAADRNGPNPRVPVKK